MRDKTGNELKVGDFIAAPYHVSMTSTTGVRIEVVEKVFDRTIGGLYLKWGDEIRSGHPGPEIVDVVVVNNLPKDTKEFRALHTIRERLLAA